MGITPNCGENYLLGKTLKVSIGKFKNSIGNNSELLREAQVGIGFELVPIFYCFTRLKVEISREGDH